MKPKTKPTLEQAELFDKHRKEARAAATAAALLVAGMVADQLTQPEPMC